MLVGTHAEVADGLTGVLGTAEQQGVGTSGLLESQLVEGLDGAAGGNDASAGSGGETQGGDVHLGDLEQTDIVSDGADNDDGLLLVAVLEVGLDAREGDGGTVHAGHEETTQDDLVEGRVGTACGGKLIRPDFSGMAGEKMKASGIAGCRDLRARKRYSLTKSFR